MGGLLMIAAGPALLVSGGLLLLWAIRLYRRRAWVGVVIATLAGCAALMAGLAITASAALLIVYALTHNPPRDSAALDAAVAASPS